MDSIGLAAAPFDRITSTADPGRGGGRSIRRRLFFDLGVRTYRAGLRNALVVEDSRSGSRTGAADRGRPLLLVRSRQVEESGGRIFRRWIADFER